MADSERKKKLVYDGCCAEEIATIPMEVKIEISESEYRGAGELEVRPEIIFTMRPKNNKAFAAILDRAAAQYHKKKLKLAKKEKQAMANGAAWANRN
jgi:hypothetical protein